MFLYPTTAGLNTFVLPLSEFERFGNETIFGSRFPENPPLRNCLRHQGSDPHRS